MNWDRFEGNLKQLDGAIKENLARLFGIGEEEDDAWCERMEGVVQEHFGLAKEDVEERYERMTMV